MELKPCPFCGAEAILEPWMTKGGYKANVDCTGCLATMYSGVFDTQEEAEKSATDKWNRRI